jgi:pimeloyl-ACP methyl ester carboxylesterase
VSEPPIALLRAVLLALASSCAACSSVTLVDETAVAPYADLVRRDAALDSVEYDLVDPTDRFVRFHFRDVRSANAAAAERPVIVLLNGVFSDGATWRFDTALLAEDFDVLALDLPGTGRSPQGDPDLASPEAYGLAWTADRTWRALARWQELQPRPRALFLAGHSVGGAVVIRMVGHPSVRERWSGELGRVVGIGLLATPDVATAKWSDTLVELTNLSDAEVGLGDALGVLSARVAEGIAKNVARPEAAFALEETRITRALLDRDRRRASQLLLRRIRPVDEDDVPDWPAARRLAEDHGRVDVPALVLWGRDDSTLPLADGEKLARELPRGELVVVDRADHSLHQESPRETVLALRTFVLDLAGY